MAPKNFHVVFAKRPGVNGFPNEDNFRYESCEYPQPLEFNEVLVKTLYLSVDPAQRCQMNESTNVNYLNPWELEKTIEGLGGVGIVLESRHPKWFAGDHVVNSDLKWPWKLYCNLPGNHLARVNTSKLNNHLSLPLSCLGLTGLTALLGLQEKGFIVPGTKQTVVISAAGGATGSLAGQIAKLLGAHKVIGICGSDTKCQFLTQELGFTAAFNYKTQSTSEMLIKHSPGGIHVYFDNVGGDVSIEVLKQMAPGGHVVLCGQISMYNTDLPYPPPLPDDMVKLLADRSITRERFLVLHYEHKFATCLEQLETWVTEGKIKVRETIEKGLENAGKAFIMLMKGKNIGKELVHVSD